MSYPSRMRATLRGIRILIFVLALFPIALAAQNPRGTIRGTIHDTTGGRIPGARIVVQATESSLQREVLSDTNGEFRINELQPDSYHVTVQANGFADASADVKVAVSSVREITVTLKLAALQQQS